jgi:hypothetical protein
MRLIIPAILLLVGTGPLTATASAQGVADRLACFRVKDTAPKARYRVSIANGGGSQTCTVRTPAELGCIATATTAITPAPPGGSPSGAAVPSFLCYRAKCPRPTANGDSEDEFGQRLVSFRGSQLYCTPASLAAPTPGTTTTTLAGGGTQGCQFSNGECTGSCGPGQRCGTAVGTASCECRAVACGDADTPECDGACPDPGDACIFGVTGCSCVHVP